MNSQIKNQVDKYINLSGSKSRAGYIEDLLFIWEQEKVDWFLPAHSKNYLYVADVEAKMKMKQKANFEGRAFGSLCINDSSLAKAQITILIKKAGCFCERKPDWNTRRILQLSVLLLTKFRSEKF